MGGGSLELEGGSRVGQYEVEKRLGRGGMGAVYRATHLGTGRSVALKVISRGLLGSADAEERFRREAKALGRLKHPNVVDITDFGVDHSPAGDQPFLVMELVDGQSLRDELNEKKRLSLARVVDLIEQVARALDAAHAAGIVHRDLKPENVQLVPLGGGEVHVKVLDFGIAKLADRADIAPVTLPAAPVDSSAMVTASEVLTGVALMGTPPYMAPEQFFTEPIDARCDVYALAVMTWELLCGDLPRSGNMLAVCAQHVTKAPLPKLRSRGVPRAVKELLVVALARDPADRPATAGRFAARLRALAAGEAALYQLASRSVPRRVLWRTALCFVGLPFAFVVALLESSAGPMALVALPACPWVFGGLAAVSCASRHRLLDVLRGPVLATISAGGVPLRDVWPLGLPLVMRSVAAIVWSLIGSALAVLAAILLADAIMFLRRLSDGEFLDRLGPASFFITLFTPFVAATVVLAVLTGRQIAAAELLVASYRGSPPRVPVGGRLRGAWRSALPVVIIVIAVAAFMMSRRAMLEMSVAVPLNLSTWLLLRAGADATPVVDSDPVRVAIDRGLDSSDVFVELLETRQGRDESALLGPAVAASNVGAVEALLATRPASVDLLDAQGRSALSRAADLPDPQKRFSIVKALLGAGADLDAVNRDGFSARGRLRALRDERLDRLIERVDARRAPPRD